MSRNLREAIRQRLGLDPAPGPRPPPRPPPRARPIQGIGKDELAQTIRSWWRKLALEHHPDKHDDKATAEAVFKALNSAQERLKKLLDLE